MSSPNAAHDVRSSCAPTRAPCTILCAALALVSWAFCACDGERASDGEEPAEIEFLAFVPSADTLLPASTGERHEPGNAEALLVDRYELTRRDWKHWVETHQGRDPEWAVRMASWSAANDDWPADSLTQDEARIYAASRGMRLLSAREWLRITLGPSGQPWPWGQTEALGVANTLELGLGHATPVGTFERGKSALGIYDLVGNVWEWVDPPLTSPADATHPGADWSWAMGGSYASRRRRMFDPDNGPTDPDNRPQPFPVLFLDPRSRFSDVGVRCGADARAWLVQHASELARLPHAAERLVRVGAQWGRDASPWLDGLARAAPNERAFAWLAEGARR